MELLTTTERELASRRVRSLQPNAFDAEAYINRGWAVFPLAAGTKLPTKGSHGLHDATLDRGAVPAMFREPDLNIGIRTGEISRLFVVDIDLHSEEANGHESMAELKRQGFDLPFGDHKKGCAIITTPTGGMHLYYAIREGVRLKNTSGLIAPGIDTRGEGGYVVAPPSRTEKGAYTRQQDPAQLLQAPEWLVEKCRVELRQENRLRKPLRPTDEMSPKVREVLTDRLNEIAGATAGQRNDTLNRHAFYLAGYIGRGFSESDLVALLLDAARQSDMPDWEARRTIDSALRSQRQQAPFAVPRQGESRSQSQSPSMKLGRGLH